MQHQTNYNNKKLDSYSVLICAKYFQTQQDFINIIFVNSKFQETTEKFRYNPIPITSLNLFPKIQTQYLYTKDDEMIKGKSVIKYEILYEITYDEVLKIKENIKCHHLIYTRENRIQYGDVIPDKVIELGDKCYGKTNSKRNNESKIREINIPIPVKTLGNNCFCNCSSLTSITLPSSIKTLGKRCFIDCSSLVNIILPSTLTSLSNSCFHNCFSLKSINLPIRLLELGENCFGNCTSLESINLPSTLTTIKDHCFSFCSSLTSINLPSTLTAIGVGLFFYCSSMKSINLPSTINTLHERCFSCCSSLTSINSLVEIKTFGRSCFLNCDKLLDVISVPTTCFY